MDSIESYMSTINYPSLFVMYKPPASIVTIPRLSSLGSNINAINSGTFDALSQYTKGISTATGFIIEEVIEFQSRDNSGVYRPGVDLIASTLSYSDSMVSNSESNLKARAGKATQDRRANTEDGQTVKSADEYVDSMSRRKRALGVASNPTLSPDLMCVSSCITQCSKPWGDATLNCVNFCINNGCSTATTTTTTTTTTSKYH